MSRFETNRHRLDYEYGYDSSWDTRSNSYREVLSPPRRSLSGGNMIIYDMDRPDPRHHQHHHRHSHRTRDSKSSRASHREQREADRQTTAYLLTDREDREKESLKQRMSLSRTSLAPSRRHTSSKARSLSLSRSRSFANTSSDSDLDSADDSEDPDRERNQAHRPLVKYYQTEPAAPPPQLPPAVTWPSGHGGHGGGGGHDHRRRSRPPSSSLSLGRRASRSPDLDLGLAEEGDEGGRGRYQRGFGLIEQRHGQSHSADPRVEVMAEDLRFGLGRMGLGPDGRVLGGRSASFEVGGGPGRRKGVSLSPGRIERAVASKRRPLHPQYNQVYALILTWEFHDLRTASYTAPAAVDYISLEDETKRLRQTLEGYGYTVIEFDIPMDRPVEKLKARIKNFCRHAADDTLLMVYYHGHGSLDDENELVFSSHEHPANPEWSQAAAAELYAALLVGDVCSKHGRKEKHQQLTKKYERYRPVAEVKWEDIRPIVLGAPCDVLLVLDCCAAGAANLHHANWQPPPATERFTKHLFAACGFESSTSDDMTAAMCDILDTWVPGQGLLPDPMGPNGDGAANGGGAGGGAATGKLGTPLALASPPAGSPFITTKRLHQIMEDRLQRNSAGSQPIFKQLLPHDPEQHITLPNLLDRGVAGRRGRSRGYFVA